MEQREIYDTINGILHKYVSVHGNANELAKAIYRLMEHRGITTDKPMMATGFALIARDVLNELEGTYTNPAEL